MSRPLAIVMLLAVALAIGAIPDSTSSAHPGPPGGAGESGYAPGEVLIKFKPHARAIERASARAQLNALSLHTFRSGAEHWILGPGVTVERALRALKRNPNVEYAEPNHYVEPYAVPDDTRFGEQWSLQNTGQTGGTPDADIDADQAWDIETGSAGVVVAVIDTGTDWEHQDLAANIWTNPGETLDGLDNDGNGYIDDIHGYDFNNDDGDPSPSDSTVPPGFPCLGNPNIHGTHTAGIIGAVAGNAEGIAGVSWSVSIMALRAVGFGGTVAGAIEAVDYAVDNGAHVINASWGIGEEFNQTLYDAIEGAGQQEIPFVVAAGNNAIDLDLEPRYPSGFDLDNIISVALTTHDDLKGPASNFGAVTVDLGAPGKDILSTIARDQCPPEITPGPKYGVLSGTSMAAPHVTGVAALMRAFDTDITVAELKTALLDATDPLPDLEFTTVSGGRLNAHLALQILAQQGGGGPKEPPVFR